ncbi:hypothetical protein TRAPUB_8522 [Trametes pubescens]|uniref:Uncharacterized protein n=1 Tax=Trametes pubescens TaxID=154538 RepID=A0A1M2W527_TRAPU|nr:hypothetical protein TRAPUB_8522 [Trametes pubescens]
MRAQGGGGSGACGTSSANAGSAYRRPCREAAAVGHGRARKPWAKTNYSLGAQNDENVRLRTGALGGYGIGSEGYGIMPC